MMNFYDTAKRAFDVIISASVLFILSPLFLVVGILIKKDSHGPVFFIQKRVGKNGKLFKIYKFRTMIEGAQETGKLVTDSNDLRITDIGKFLRKHKLDEVPQFINVLKGDISIIGPRPEVSKYVDYYSEAQKNIILSVKPGAMGLATLDFINEEEIVARSSNWEESYIKEILPKKIVLDIKYVKNRSILFDCKIFLKNIIKIFFKK